MATASIELSQETLSVALLLWKAWGFLEHAQLCSWARRGCCSRVFLWSPDWTGCRGLSKLVGLPWIVRCPSQPFQRSAELFVAKRTPTQTSSTAANTEQSSRSLLAPPSRQPVVVIFADGRRGVSFLGVANHPSWLSTGWILTTSGANIKQNHGYIEETQKGLFDTGWFAAERIDRPMWAYHNGTMNLWLVHDEYMWSPLMTEQTQTEIGRWNCCHHFGWPSSHKNL